MKTAISLDDHLMIKADHAAREIGVSRSRLVSLALEKYLRGREHDKVLEQLNSVYGEPDAAEKRVLPKMKRKFRMASKERW